jgi:hypothetical protein
MNLQENIERIKSMMGLIVEQTTPKCNSWADGTFVQGDGIKTPKITITKSPTLIEGLYEGPDNGGCIQRKNFLDSDTPHQLAGITVYYTAAPYLKELYRAGTYVKPDMGKITMDRVKNKSFKISIPLIKTTEDQAITNMNERGGMNHTGDLREINDIKNDPNNKLIETVTITAGDITETFICFRKIIDFPIKTVTSKATTQQPTNNNEEITIEVSDVELNNLSQKFKDEISKKIPTDKLYYFSSSEGPTLQSDNSMKYKLTLTTQSYGHNGFNTYRILFNEKGMGKESLTNVLNKNPGSEEIKNNDFTANNGKTFECHLVGLNVTPAQNINNTTTTNKSQPRNTGKGKSNL